MRIALRRGWLLLVASSLAALLAAPVACAHPGSGIAVHGNGDVYFVHTGVGVFRIDRNARLTQQPGTGYHFLILDPEGRFLGQRWPRFPDGVIEVAGSNPSVLLASSFPVAIGRDGALYYPEPMSDGRVHVMRLQASARPVSFAVLPPATEIAPDGRPVVATWIHGLAAARDGTFYYAERNAIRRIGTDGSITTVVDPIKIADCVRPNAFADGARPGAALRGLDVTPDGAVYAAASGCSTVVKVAASGALSVALRASDSWSPTGIALSDGDVYVLEYHYIPVERRQDWLPRVRKLSRDGTVTTIVSFGPP